MKQEVEDFRALRKKIGYFGVLKQYGLWWMIVSTGVWVVVLGASYAVVTLYGQEEARAYLESFDALAVYIQQISTAHITLGLAMVVAEIAFPFVGFAPSVVLTVRAARWWYVNAPLFRKASSVFHVHLFHFNRCRRSRALLKK